MFPFMWLQAADERGIGRLRMHEVEDAVKVLLKHGDPVKYGNRDKTEPNADGTAENADGTDDGDSTKDTPLQIEQEQPAPTEVVDDAATPSGADETAAVVSSDNSHDQIDVSSKPNPALEKALSEVMKHPMTRALLYAPPALIKHTPRSRVKQTHGTTPDEAAAAKFEPAPAQPPVQGHVGEMLEGDFIHMVGRQIWPLKESVTAFLVRKYLHRDLDEEAHSTSASSGHINANDMHFLEAIVHQVTVTVTVKVRNTGEGTSEGTGNGTGASF